MEDWEIEQANESLDNEMLEMMRARMRELQEKNHVTIVNPEKYAEAYRVIGEIKKIVDGYLKQYLPETESDNYDDEGNFIDPGIYVAEYKEFLTGPILSHSLCFIASIPSMGVEFTYDDINRVFSILPAGTSVSIYPGFKSDKTDASVISFHFPDVHFTSWET